VGFCPREHLSDAEWLSELESEARSLIAFFQEPGLGEYDQMIASIEDLLEQVRALADNGFGKEAGHRLSWALKVASSIRDGLTAPRDVSEVERITGYKSRSLYEPIRENKLPHTVEKDRKKVSILAVRQYHGSGRENTNNGRPLKRTPTSQPSTEAPPPRSTSKLHRRSYAAK
jgi:hypothetical protein